MNRLNRIYNRVLNRIFPKRRETLLTKIMKMDQELGLYDEPFNTKDNG